MPFASHETPDVFAVDHSGGAGLTRRQTQGATFTSPTPGVRVRSDTPFTPELAVQIALTARPESTLTDLSAAREWNLPLPPWLTDAPTSVAVPAGNSRTRRTGIRGRRLALPPEHLTELHSRTLTNPARTWLDCAGLVPLGHCVAMGDAILRRTLSSEQELRRMCHWAYRRRGVAIARRALTLLDPGSESPGESLARVVLVTGGVPRPVCNADIIVNGEWLARADLLWKAARVIAEYDGAVHLEEEQRRRDAARRNLLQEAGFYVIVFTARDLARPEQMCATVRAALRSRTPC